ncbi:hypothetical protein EDB92DRAFT_1832128 [Lactarius akahatsu]|uniref:Uncharacterized protein n=1 Tax=Lactarius akahatsu TaxID=416441 RepID=A0AAD4LQB4_9AGAM|nr:hypothetical protein EDB92DRAFT_1832128 [Lactarius akahatsu]
MDGSDITPEEHAEIRMTKWWSAEEMVRQGVPCREGPYTDIEKEQVDGAINRYKAEHNLSLEDIEDIIFGATRKDGFWATVACAVPSRRIRSVYDHVQRAYHPLRMKGKWHVHEDSALVKFVKEYKSDWTKIGEAMQRMPESCRGRYQQYLVYAETERKGRWSDEEGARLACIIETMSTEGKTSTTSQKFWKEVAARMGNTRSPKQCRGKWNDSLNPRLQNQGRKPRWGPLDIYVLVHKIASLGLDFEVDIPWNILPDDGWKSWSGHRLQQKWAILKKTVWVEGATHHDIVQRLLALHGTLPNNSPVRENQPSTTENNS